MKEKNSDRVKELKDELALKKSNRKSLDSEIKELEERIKQLEHISDNQTTLF